MNSKNGNILVLNHCRLLKIIFSIISCLLFMGCLEGNKKSTYNKGNNPKVVMFIIVDDLNENLNVYGDKDVKTPKIERLASMNIQCNNAYCNYPVCNPSRTSLLSRIRPVTSGILDNVTPFQGTMSKRMTLPALFKENGYFEMGLGKIFHLPTREHYEIGAWDEIYNYHPANLGEKGKRRNLAGDVMNWCYRQAAQGPHEDKPDAHRAQKSVSFPMSKIDKLF